MHLTSWVEQLILVHVKSQESESLPKDRLKGIGGRPASLPWCRGLWRTRVLMGLPAPHKPGQLPKETSQVETPAAQRVDLLKLSGPGFTLDVDIVDWSQLTQKPSCRVQSGCHKHTQAIALSDALWKSAGRK